MVFRTALERFRKRVGRTGQASPASEHEPASAEALSDGALTRETVDAHEGHEESVGESPDGLKTLHPPISRDRDAPSPASMNVDIVAIHGLGGGPYSTWRDGGTNKVWLRDFLPNDLPDSHIMSFGYNSRWAFSNSASNVEDYARELLEILIARRARVQTESNPLIFICHSLGGLVFKKALIIAHERQSRYADLLSRVKGVIFFGTPHRGASSAYWGKIFGTIVRIPHLNLLRRDLFQDLEHGSRVLGDICTQFVERAAPLHIVTVYECKKFKGLNDLIVDKDSAILNLPNETIKPIDADHSSMCKFDSAISHGYEYVLASIVELHTIAIGSSNRIQLPLQVPTSHNDNSNQGKRRATSHPEARTTNREDTPTRPHADVPAAELQRRPAYYVLSKVESRTRRSNETEREHERSRRLLKAASEGQMPLVKRLLDLGAYVDFDDDNGLIALHHAVLSGSTDIVEILLQKASDINTLSLAGTTPLCLAVSRTRNDLVRLLLDHKAEVNYQGSHGRAALHTAATVADGEATVETLLDYGAEVNRRDNKLRTPLHYAAEVGTAPVARKLLQYLADPNCKDKTGDTPLHYAAKSGSAELTQILLESGADTEIMNNDGKLARDYWPFEARDDTGVFSSLRLWQMNDEYIGRMTLRHPEPRIQKRPAVPAYSRRGDSSHESTVSENERRVVEVVAKPISQNPGNIGQVGQVYALRDPELDLVKIGFTTTGVERRREHITRSLGMSKARLRTIAISPDVSVHDYRRLEQAVHQDLRPHRWYLVTTSSGRRSDNRIRATEDWYHISDMVALQTLKLWGRIIQLDLYTTPQPGVPGTLKEFWATRLREREEVSSSETHDDYNERLRRWAKVFLLDAVP